MSERPSGLRRTRQGRDARPRAPAADDRITSPALWPPIRLKLDLVVFTETALGI
jgi:hypothetical protein